MSNAGYDQESNYHMNLLEEKRGEIQSLIKKRQKKMQLGSLDVGKPRMGAFNVKLQANGSLFPEITPKRERPPIKIGHTTLGSTDME